MGEEMPAETAALFNTIMSFVLIGFIGMFGISMNTGAATTITREGGNFWLLKTVPVTYRTQIKAKLLLYVAISTVTVAVSLAVSALLAFDAVNLICGIIFC